MTMENREESNVFAGLPAGPHTPPVPAQDGPVMALTAEQQMRSTALVAAAHVIAAAVENGGFVGPGTSQDDEAVVTHTSLCLTEAFAAYLATGEIPASLAIAAGAVTGEDVARTNVADLAADSPE